MTMANTMQLRAIAVVTAKTVIHMAVAGGPITRRSGFGFIQRPEPQNRAPTPHSEPLGVKLGAVSPLFLCNGRVPSRRKHTIKAQRPLNVPHFQKGPLENSKGSGLSRRYCTLWREVADAAGIPKHTKNMNGRG